MGIDIPKKRNTRNESLSREFKLEIKPNVLFIKHIPTDMYTNKLDKSNGNILNALADSYYVWNGIGSVVVVRKKHDTEKA